MAEGHHRFSGDVPLTGASTAAGSRQVGLKDCSAMQDTELLQMALGVQRTHPVKATGESDLYAATAGAVAFRQFQGNNSPRRLAG